MAKKTAQNLRGPIRGVVFDMDGTLTLPVLDFSILRQKLGISSKQDILKYAHGLKTAEEQKNALNIIEEFEIEGEKNLQLQPGLISVMSTLHSKGIKQAILTRNAERAVEAFMNTLRKELQATSNGAAFDRPLAEVFDPVLTRDFKPYKPHPAPLHHIAAIWDFPLQNMLMVGDAVDDMLCAKSAGVQGVLLDPLMSTDLIRGSSTKLLNGNERLSDKLIHARQEAEVLIEKLEDLLPLILHSHDT
eukprot:Nk52_evm8s372 gene=Nk52_evmTU8s372